MTFPANKLVRDRVTGRVGTVVFGRRFPTSDSVAHGVGGFPKNSPGSVYAWLVKWGVGGSGLFPVHGAGNLLPPPPRFEGNIPRPWPEILVDETVNNAPGFEPWGGTPPRLAILPGA